MKTLNRIAPFYAAVLALLLSAAPGHAAPDVSVAELQAIVQTLGFLSNLPNAGVLNIGVVYAPDQAGGEARAGQVVSQLNGLRGPNQRALRGIAVATRDLARAPQPLDIFLLMPGTSGQSEAIGDAVRRRHVISISTDPACLDANCCVLMVSAQGRVRIVLDTALASAAGAQFSSVFAMMVTRK